MIVYMNTDYMYVHYKMFFVLIEDLWHDKNDQNPT